VASARFDFFCLIFMFLGVIWPESCYHCEFSFLPLFLGPRVRLCSHTRSFEGNSFSFSCFGCSASPLLHNLFHADLFWLTFSPKFSSVSPLGWNPACKPSREAISPLHRTRSIADLGCSTFSQASAQVLHFGFWFQVRRSLTSTTCQIAGSALEFGLCVASGCSSALKIWF
jgi:hypothetical protein